MGGDGDVKDGVVMVEEELNAQMLCVLEWDGCGIYRESEKRNLN